jgi:hypothetical protein
LDKATIFFPAFLVSIPGDIQIIKAINVTEPTIGTKGVHAFERVFILGLSGTR